MGLKTDIRIGLCHRFTLDQSLNIHYYSLKCPKPDFFMKNRLFPMTSGRRSWSRPGPWYVLALRPCPKPEFCSLLNNEYKFYIQFSAYNFNVIGIFKKTVSGIDQEFPCIISRFVLKFKFNNPFPDDCESGLSELCWGLHKPTLARMWNYTTSTPRCQLIHR